VAADDPATFRKAIAEWTIWKHGFFDVTAWTDGSAMQGTHSGGSGVAIFRPNGLQPLNFSSPAGAFCSSYRAEQIAMYTCLLRLSEQQDDDALRWSSALVCTDSRSLLQRLEAGPTRQEDQLGESIWCVLVDMACSGGRIVMQWVPAHCGLEGNELADQLAKAGCAHPQQYVEIALATARTVIHRHVAASWQHSVRSEMNAWHIDACGGRREWPIPPDLDGLHRRDCVTIHQLRTGTSSLLHN
jgi:ribonuclease HI